MNGFDIKKISHLDEGESKPATSARAVKVSYQLNYEARSSCYVDMSVLPYETTFGIRVTFFPYPP